MRASVTTLALMALHVDLPAFFRAKRLLTYSADVLVTLGVTAREWRENRPVAIRGTPKTAAASAATARIRSAGAT